MSETLTNAIERLEGVLNRETEALRTGGSIDFSDVTQRKNQSLLDLTRLQRGMGEAPSDPRVQALLQRLNEALVANRRALEAHVTASRELAEMVSGSLAANESDGTYSARIGRA